MRATVVTTFLLLASTICFAQGDRGTVTGTVVDPGGALVPNAKVIAKNIETGSQYQTEATATGNFTLAALVAGTYEVRVSSPGFSTHVQTGVRVQVAQTIRLDVALQIARRQTLSQ